MIFEIHDLDDSNSRLAPLVESIAGFPLANLLRLYLFEDGDVDDDYTTVRDASAAASHATLLSGSSGVTRSAGGVVNDAAPGFALDTGVAMSGAKTIIITAQDAEAPSDGSASDLMVMMAPLARLVLPMSSTQTNYGPGLFLTQQNWPATNVGNRRLYAGGAGATFADANNVKQIPSVPADPDAYITAAISWDFATGVLRFVGTNGTTQYETTETALLGAVAALSTNIALGIWQNQALGASGTLALAAIYDGLSSLATMTELMSRARARVAQRGVVVV